MTSTTTSKAKTIEHGAYHKAFLNYAKWKSVINFLLALGIGSQLMGLFIEVLLNNMIFTDESYLTIAYVLYIVSAVAVATSLICNLISQFKFKEAEELERNDCIDNAFDSNLLLVGKSENYFTNDELEFGVYKYGVNYFESCFFTDRILDDMIKEQKKYYIPIFFIYTLAFVIFLINFFELTPPIIVNSLTALFLIIYIVSESFILRDFNRSNKKTLDSFRSCFENIKEAFEEKMTAKSIERHEIRIMNNVLQFETNISRSRVKLNSRIYNDHKDTYNREWVKLKANFKINAQNSKLWAATKKEKD